MSKLNAYDCFSGSTLEEYIEISKIFHAGKDENAIRTYARMFLNMGGVFWSKKYQNLFGGKTENMNFISLEEFKDRLKNTLS